MSAQTPAELSYPLSRALIDWSKANPSFVVRGGALPIIAFGMTIAHYVRYDRCDRPSKRK